MFSKLAVFFAAAAVVAAVPTPGDAPTTVVNKTVNKCNVGEVQCCKQVQSAQSAQVAHQAGLLNIAFGALQGQAGLNCSPISVIGVGAGANCNASPVCCDHNNFNGVLALGCNPVNLNL